MGTAELDDIVVYRSVNRKLKASLVSQPLTMASLSLADQIGGQLVNSSGLVAIVHSGWIGNLT